MMSAWVLEQVRHFNHHALVGMYLENLRLHTLENGDVLIKDGRRLVVHSMVVGAHSGYFRAVIARERPPFKVNVSESEFSSAAIMDAIQFMYEAKFQPRPGNIPDLFLLADKWKIFDLKGVLEDIICELLNGDIYWLSYCFKLTTDPHYRLSVAATEFILSAALQYHCVRFVFTTKISKN